MRRRVALVACALVVAMVAVALLSGGREPYRLRLVLDNAAGLRAGSDVRIGDVTAGRVASVALGRDDRVVVELELRAQHAPVGRNPAVAIASLNLLGQKYVALDRGDVAHPAPSGFTVPRSRVSVATELDQVLGVLDADTRARLQILIGEAGRALTGRRADFNALLRELPGTASAATRLLDQLVGDTHTLGRLVERSDRFVAAFARERRGMTALVEQAGRTADVLADRRAAMRASLARAPGMLRSLERFLADLRTTTVPLGPAARDLSAGAPALGATLAQLGPFRRAAAPALRQGRAAAPALTRLATGATPVLRRARPTVGALARLGRGLVPVTDALDDSAANLLATVHNWSGAIQLRDGLSHVFNGAASITPETLLTLIRRLERGRGRTRRDRPARRPAPAATTAPRPAPRRPQPQLPAVGSTVDKALSGVIDALPVRPQRGSEQVSELLDFLLGR